MTIRVATIITKKKSKKEQYSCRYTVLDDLLESRELKFVLQLIVDTTLYPWAQICCSFFLLQLAVAAIAFVDWIHMTNITLFLTPVLKYWAQCSSIYYILHRPIAARKSHLNIFYLFVVVTKPIHCVVLLRKSCFCFVCFRDDPSLTAKPSRIYSKLCFLAVAISDSTR